MKIHENYKNLCGTKDDEADKPTKKININTFEYLYLWNSHSIMQLTNI
jgi:hypothetical protein